jgi:hypothetical protein
MEDSRDQWPKVFNSLKSLLEETGNHLTLAESWAGKKEAGLCSRKLTCGLVREDEYEAITGSPELGHEVECTGPYPRPREGGYEPNFRIFGTAAIPNDIEPLVLSWTSNNQTVQHPDPGLLMTYGLMPRVEKDGITHWDEPARPIHDVLTVKPVSRYEYPHQTMSKVSILRDFLQDYATLRQLSVVCVFYERWIVEDDENLGLLLAGKRDRDLRFKDAYIRVQSIRGSTSKFHVEIWGHRLLLRPGPLPISEDAERFGELSWPGIPNPITDENWRGQEIWFVYVKDDVLARFEGRPGYKLHPESGSVSFGAEWDVSYCNRIGRDLIQLEVRKLYEGNSPDIVRHFHSHAVTPPSDAMLDGLRSTPNIATRARDVIHALVRLGEAIAAIASRVHNRTISSSDVVSLDRHTLDYYGWWKAKGVEPICRHVPLSATRDTFVSRCKDMYQVVGEGLSPSTLRGLLKGLGVDGSSIQDFGSLKLLCQIVELAMLASKNGLDLVSDSESVVARHTSRADPSPCRHLFALYNMRLLDAHRAEESFDQKLQEGLHTFGVDPVSTAPGYGQAVDAMYDSIAKELNECADALPRNRFRNL